MIIIFFTLLSLVFFLFTKSYRYITQYYSTVLYVSFISVLYALICSDYGMWQFANWWIFTDHASALVQAAILFPSTTVIFLRYLPKTKKFFIPYFLLFPALYVGMEWITLGRNGIRYLHGWNFGWSVLIDILMFCMILVHHYHFILAWALSTIIIVFLLSWFHVPLFIV